MKFGILDLLVDEPVRRPDARSILTNALRAFENVARDCDRNLFDDIGSGRIAPPAVVESDRFLTEIPPIEQRTAEIRVAACDCGCSIPTSLVAMRASVGCPCSCNFYIGRSTPYEAFPVDRLRVDRQFSTARWSEILAGYHDPSFAVRFDKTMDAIESVPRHLWRRNGHYEGLVRDSLVTPALEPPAASRDASDRHAHKAGGTMSAAH